MLEGCDKLFEMFDGIDLRLSKLPCFVSDVRGLGTSSFGREARCKCFFKIFTDSKGMGVYISLPRYRCGVPKVPL